MSAIERSLSRRRVLSIVGATAALPAGALALRQFAGESRMHRWDGEALGAMASLRLWHHDETFARRTIRRVLAEVDRLERIFSLYRPDSEIARLNRDGAIERPSRDFALVIEESRRIGALSGGAFDITVQPLWDLHAESFNTNGRAPDQARLDDVLRLVDASAMGVEARRIAFARAGMAVTLNGIAQGYVTDRAADLLREEGFDHVVVDLGEIRALGEHPEHRPWRVGLKDPQAPTRIARTIELREEAVAVSGGYGTQFQATGRDHHIFDPRTGRSAQRLADVTVVAPRAMLADGLSTAIFVAGEAASRPLVAAHRGTRAILTRPDGTSLTV